MFSFLHPFILYSYPVSHKVGYFCKILPFYELDVLSSKPIFNFFHQTNPPFLFYTQLKCHLFLWDLWEKILLLHFY